MQRPRTHSEELKELYLVLDLDYTLLDSTQLVDLSSDEEYLKSNLESQTNPLQGKCMLQVLNSLCYLAWSGAFFFSCMSLVYYYLVYILLVGLTRGSELLIKSYMMTTHKPISRKE